MTDESNQIEAALYFAHAHAVTEGPDVPDWEPHEVWFQLFRFCDEVRAIEGIIANALESGDVAMLSRAAAQLQYTSDRQFGGISSAVTFTAGRIIQEGPSPAENEVAGAKGKYERLFESLIEQDLVGGDLNSGRTSARMTDMMHRWVAEQHDNFIYLMTSSLRDMGWSDEQVSEFTDGMATPDLDMGLMESLDSDLLEIFEDSDDTDEEK